MARKNAPAQVIKSLVARLALVTLATWFIALFSSTDNIFAGTMNAKYAVRKTDGTDVLVASFLVYQVPDINQAGW